MVLICKNTVYGVTKTSENKNGRTMNMQHIYLLYLAPESSVERLCCLKKAFWQIKERILSKPINFKKWLFNKDYATGQKNFWIGNYCSLNQMIFYSIGWKIHTRACTWIILNNLIIAGLLHCCRKIWGYFRFCWEGKYNVWFYGWHQGLLLKSANDIA